MSTTSWDLMFVATFLIIVLVIGLCFWEKYNERPRGTDSLRTDCMTLLPPEKIHHKLTVCRLPEGFVPPVVTVEDEQKPVYELTVEQQS
ncbi:unnamed protein product [Bursaphelenchus xylophilus]|uniref:(pine wood nematode) hypothetical protein n=1 Tax=Bursaphelenchus xylophilus TaxID=6326 RepID=A0A1I7SS44_BURXY|nr:unnamed protein product [Bursaphelenchus xylophilus]CAG9105693.1 unnamed protein product [Bursaphelenchus xylophilus]